MSLFPFRTQSLLPLAVIAHLACGVAFADPDPEGLRLYREKIAPLFEANCAECHGTERIRAGLSVTSPAALLKGSERGAVIVPGDTANSRLLQVLRHSQEPHMPLNADMLPEEDLLNIEAWIRRGAPVPGESLATEAPEHDAATAELVVTDRDRAFWSFQPLQRVEPPAAAASGWEQNPIDRFVSAGLQEAGLSPSPEADRRTLIRRLHFDLTGLPPAPERVEQFVADPDPAAYEKLVDELLATQQFGERWARHWLDVARYADSDGYEFDLERANAYPYRDFVIKAFNEDMPYDQFVKWQIAGDEYAPDEPMALAATGFLAAGPLIDNQQNEKNLYDELDDIVSTVGSGMLAMTLGCARCHDHKYDAIPSRDYYRLLTAFRSMKRYQAYLAPRAEAEKYQREFKAWEADHLLHKKAFEEFTNPLKAAARDAFINSLPLPDLERDLLRKSPPDPQNITQVELHEKYGKELQRIEHETKRTLPRDQQDQWEQLEKAFTQSRMRQPQSPPRAYALTDAQNTPIPSYMLARGNVDAKQEQLELGFLSVLPGNDSPRFKPGQYKPELAATTYQRTAVAEWLTNVEEGAGRLTARVMVNRLWHHHFGLGIVRTPNDFGIQGDRPTHPQLLDWLAAELVAQGWKLKPLHRLILTSQAWRQASTWDPARALEDPENRLWWRRAPVRLEAEIVRDAILASSGMLNPKMFGPGVFPYMHPDAVATGSTGKWPTDVKDGPETWRRSVYVFARRSVRLPEFEAFDQPDTVLSCGRRVTTTIPSQALHLMNSQFVNDQARHLAARVLREAGPDPKAWVDRACQLTISRSPRPLEHAEMVDFLMEQAERQAATAVASEAEGTDPEDPRHEALVDLCHVLYGLNEFVYIN